MPYTTKYNPAEDGKTHLNIYSNGATEIGRFLSNFTKSPIETPDGKFLSVEGYWHWLGIKSTPIADVMHRCYGYKAKQIGTQLKKTYGKRFDKNFENKIKAAIKYKLDQNQDLLLENINLITLPIVHYYVFTKNNNILIYDAQPDFSWMIDYIKEYLTEFAAAHERS